jgi:hypothetical protein
MLTGVMEEERVISLGIVDEPSHGTNHVGLGRSHHWILLVVCQNDHVLSFVSVSLDQEVGHVVDVVDASAKLSLLSKVINTDQQGLSTTGTVGVLESIALRGTVAELLGSSRRRGAGLSTIAIASLLRRIAVGIVALRRWVGWRRASILRLLGAVAVAAVIRRRMTR